MKQPAIIAAFLAAGLGIAVGLTFLFAPLGTECTVTSTSPGPLPAGAREDCRSTSLVQTQSVWPMPLVAIVVWSVAPSVSAIGLVRRLRAIGSGTPWIVAGLIAEATVLISFGAAPIFVPLVLLPLLLATTLGLGSSPPRSSP